MKYLLILVLFLFVSCRTTRVSVVDGYILEEKNVIRLTNKPDTIEYITLRDGEVISKKEYNRRWDKVIKETNKQIKKDLKN
jgi:hypothetical protein